LEEFVKDVVRALLVLVPAFGCSVLHAHNAAAQAPELPSGECRNWRKDGVVGVKIGPHLFHVSRLFLASVIRPSGRYDFSWRCNDVVIEAKSFFIKVTKGSGRSLTRRGRGNRSFRPKSRSLRGGGSKGLPTAI
jgi:hypothetical protein